MANIQELNKLFVRVSGEHTILDVSTQSVIDSNKKKIYFVEKQNTIVNNGIAYGINPNTAKSLNDLIAVVGQSTLGNSGVDASTVVQRLAKLEGIKVNTNSADYLNVSDGTGGDSPEIGVKLVALDDVTSSTHGLVDAANAKMYIDREVASANNKVAVGKGLNLVESSDASNASIYTVSPDFELVYVGHTNDASAHILLKSKDAENASIFGNIPVSEIIGNGLLTDTSYNANTGHLSLNFNTADGQGKTETIDLHSMLDINDMSVESGSQKYLTVALDGAQTDDSNAQAIFTVHTLPIADATTDSASNGLADAKDVKNYVDSKSTSLAVSAEGDDYVDASVDAGNNKKINVKTNVGTVTVSGGTRGTWNVTEAGEATLSNEVAPTMTADSSKLLDASQAVESVKVYVDAKVAAEAAEREAKIEAAIKGLDSENTSTGTNVTVNASIVDGKLTTLGVTESYATVTGVRTSESTADPQAATFTVTSGDENKLIKASDLVKLKNYTDDKIAENTTDLAISGQGDDYVTLEVSTNNNKQLVATANIGTFTVAKDGNNDTTITAEANKLADANAVATNVSNYVEARLDEEIAKLDSVINVKDTLQYVSVSTGIVDGQLSNASSAVEVTYGSFTNGVNDSSLGIAKVNDVITYVDTYDFWETYPQA